MGLCKIETWQLECERCHHLELIGRKVDDTTSHQMLKTVFEAHWPNGFIRHAANLREADWMILNDELLCSKCGEEILRNTRRP